MIQKILEKLRAGITGMTFIDRYGGLVKAQSAQFGVDQNQRPIIKTFPVGCFVSSADCWTQGRYNDLVPNDTKLSVSYFEEITPLTIRDYSHGKRSVANFRGVVRFVVWLNSPLLGYNDCTIAGVPILNTIAAINGRQNSVVIPEDSVYFQVLGQEVKNPAIFQQYSYDDRQQFLFWPYDYFALRVQVDYSTPFACAEPFDVRTAIECVDDSV